MEDRHSHFHGGQTFLSVARAGSAVSKAISSSRLCLGLSWWGRHSCLSRTGVLACSKRSIRPRITAAEADKNDLPHQGEERDEAMMFRRRGEMTLVFEGAFPSRMTDKNEAVRQFTGR